MKSKIKYYTACSLLAIICTVYLVMAFILVPQVLVFITIIGLVIWCIWTISQYKETEIE